MSTPALSLRAARARPARALPLGGLTAIVAASLALGSLSLLLPTTPTYDPFAWLIWGREILHLGLDTRFGPSWKPLPVLFTTAFALVPGAAPALWVALARAGGIAAIALACRVTWRLGGGALGGLVAAASLAVSAGFVRYAAIGDSEGLLAALLLAAVDLHLSGRRRAALWVAFAACLLRPEAWPFAAAYGVWLWRAEPRVRRTIGLMVPAGLALWLGPELWGSGDALRAGTRAMDPNPNAITFAEHPMRETVSRMLDMTPWPAEAGLLAVAAAWVAGRRDRRAAGFALAAAAWLALVALMTQAGFSGNPRYLIAPITLACVAGGLGWGRLFARPRRLGPTVGVAAAAALLASPAGEVPDQVRAVRNEVRLMDTLDGAIDAAGGPARVRACGSVVTGPFQVTPLAWKLGVHIEDVALVPLAPGTVFRAGPAPHRVAGAPGIVVGEPGWRLIAQLEPWEVLQACGVRRVA